MVCFYFIYFTNLFCTKLLFHVSLYFAHFFDNLTAFRHTRKVVPGTSNSSPGTRDPGPEPLRGTRDLRPAIWDSSPGNPFLGTLTLIQLSFNVQFSRVA